METNRHIWDHASRAAIVVGAVPVLYLAVTALTGKLPSLISSIITATLWLAKFIGCIWLMKFFMKRFAAAEEGVTGGDTFKFGAAVALLSALIYSACQLAYVLFINPDIFRTAVDTALSNYSSFLDSGSLSEIDEMMPKLPAITFFVNLIYCTIYGTVISAILSRNIPSSDPFKTNNS